jgi:hypothetical protein
LIDVKKVGSIVFPLNFNEFENKGKADRFLIFYKQLLKNRRLARFCREAFIEKVDRNLNGLEEQYILLNSHIKSKGIPYILDAIKEKETKSSPDIGEAEIEKVVNQIIQALMKRFQNELQIPTPINTVNTKTLPENMPDMEKLMALL